MLRIRKILLGLTLVIGMGSLSLSLAYGWYLLSADYRHSLETRISRFLELPVHIGRVRPLALHSLLLEEVQATLPDSDELIFQCQKAIWRERSGKDRHGFDLEFYRGSITIGSRAAAWRGSDYRRMLETGLGHDFSSLNLQHVRLVDMDVHVVRPNWELSVQEASGDVAFFATGGDARAYLESTTFNGFQVPQPVRVWAKFRPGPSVVLHEVELQVPVIPARSLMLDSVLGSRIQEGEFSGRIVYQEKSDGILDLSGKARNLLLDELTAGLPGGGISGRIEQLNIDSARIVRGRLEHIEFSGRLADVRLSELAAMLDLPEITGCLNLLVETGVIRGGLVADLQASGSIADADLQTVTRILGVGRITGSLDIRLDEITIQEGRLLTARIDAVVLPPADGFPTIDRKVIIEAGRRILGVDLPNLPIDDLEYVKFGVRVLVDCGQLRIMSPFDDGRGTILSIRLLGREVPIIRAPNKVFDVEDLLAGIRVQAEQFDYSRQLGRRLRIGDSSTLRDGDQAGRD